VQVLDNTLAAMTRYTEEVLDKSDHFSLHDTMSSQRSDDNNFQIEVNMKKDEPAFEVVKIRKMDLFDE